MNNPTSIESFTLTRLEPISSLMPEQVAELAAQTTEEVLLQGDTLFKTGDGGDQLTYLLQGEIEIQSQGRPPFKIVSGDHQARHPLDEHSPHQSTAIALTPVRFIRIDQNLVETMLTWAQSAFSGTEEVIMSGFDTINIDIDTLKGKMQHSENFRKLPAANIDRLLEKMEPLHVVAGETIIRQGDSGDYFYIIESGDALVTRIIDVDEESDDSVEMAQLIAGIGFGEAALISDKPRNATVSMQTDGILLRLNKKDFLTLMQEPIQNWVSATEAREKIAAGARWIDIRQRTEFQHDHLPGAINVPLNETHRNAKEMDHSIAYISYCQTGRRSSAAAFILSQYGFDISVLKGGLASLQKFDKK